MLKSWQIKNFKPILDSGDLKLAPVTVLAGRNSSGKSSLIQSILMISQTLSNRILDRGLLPNGPIVQLGTFEDILSEQTSLRTLEVGFELEMEKEKSKLSTSSKLRLEDRRVMAGSSTGIKSVKVTSKFRSASGDGTSASAIEASKVNVESVLLEVVTALSPYAQQRLFHEQELEVGTLFRFDVDIHILTPEELDQFLKGVLPEYLRFVPYPLHEPNYLGEFISKNTEFFDRLPDSSLITLSHFLPTRLFGKYIIEERRKQSLVNIIRRALIDPLEYTTVLKEFFDQYEQDGLIPNSIKEALSGFCKNKKISEEFSGETFIDLIVWYRTIKLEQKKTFNYGEIFKIIKKGILEESSQMDTGSEKGSEAIESITNNIYVENLDVAVGRITQFFTSRIRYLGPLRADPQAAQRFAPSSELDDVGAKGEYAAAVYDANQMAPTEWFNPLKKSVERNTLKVALDTWVRYLGVANEVKIQVAGQSGVSWQVVHIEGHKPLPLTAIGVGVSQLLPILVMGLLAPNNTLLLVEQPELHLHPRVQARLGDFFMGLAQCGKQCLIETHSENLISQLRYHIVQAGGQEASDCLIYFVEQDEQGASKFNPIEISAKGNILNWPDGFFDETMLQEDRITAEGLKKKVKSGKNDERYN